MFKLSLLDRLLIKSFAVAIVAAVTVAGVIWLLSPVIEVCEDLL